MWKRALTTGGIILGGTGIYLQNSERLKSYTQQNKSFDMYAYSELSFVNSKTEETPEELRKCNGSIIFTQTNPDNCIVGYDVRGLPNKEHQIFVGDVKVGQLSTKNSDGSFVGQVLNHQTKLFGSKSVIGKSVEVSEKDGKKTISVGKVQPFPIYATCTVTPQGKPCSGDDKNNDCQGIIKLKQVDPYNCHISYEVKGLSAGKHGFHIHEKADFSNGCMSAGPHYNPFNKNHGATEDSDRHVGDLGNIEPESNGIATGTIVDRQVKLFGNESVVGRSFMVHADPDDLGKGGHKLSPTTGNAGARIACGEIKLVK